MSVSSEDWSPCKSPTSPTPSVSGEDFSSFKSHIPPPVADEPREGRGSYEAGAAYSRDRESGRASGSRDTEAGTSHPENRFGGGWGRGSRRFGRSDEAGTSKDNEAGTSHPENRFGGGWGRGSRRFGRSDEAGTSKDTEAGTSHPENRFGGGWGRGSRRFGRSDEAGTSKGVGEVTVQRRPPPVSYIPPDPTEDEEEAYYGYGINFFNYDHIPVRVTGENVPKAIGTFQESGFCHFILTKLAKFTVPTPIQKRAIPCVMGGSDVLGCAQTGSGKTAAFLLPIIDTLLRDFKGAVTDGKCIQPRAVLIAPTRELAIQIYKETRKFINGSDLTASIVYGGVDVVYQINELRKGTHILVATPRRLIQFMDRGIINFQSLRFVVLDEADQMLNMNFKPMIDTIMNHVTKMTTLHCQTLMFSATFPDEIQEMAVQYLHQHVVITVGIVGGACSDVEQRFIEMPIHAKKENLFRLLRENNKRTLVFIETKRMVDYLAVQLAELGISATTIHGDRLQKRREEALNEFTKGTKRILVATAVASRGLDIKNVEHVINYDLPKEINEYVHRIGQTGRLGNRGLATSFYVPEKDSGLATALVRILAQAHQEVPDFLRAAGGYGDSTSFPGQRYNFSESIYEGPDEVSRDRDVIEGEEW